MAESDASNRSAETDVALSLARQLEELFKLQRAGTS
jgi:hypothetical protein